MYPKYDYIGKRKLCKDIPLVFPRQHQNTQPGLEYLMRPRPIFDNPDYYGNSKLKGKVALITGGDSGIGRSIAILFAKEGANIAFTYLDEDQDAEFTKNYILGLGRRCINIRGDLRYKENNYKAVDYTLRELGKIDILINNIAVQFLQDSILNITEEQLLLTYQTNVFSYFYMIQAALPHLKENASIINTSSTTSYQGEKRLIDYSSTKGAIVSLTKSLALSLADKKIRVNAVSPGPTWTPLIPASYSTEEVETFGTLTPKVPLMRAAQPFEIAPSYLFLASDDSRYMTGQVLHPNGGTIVDS
ncbi:MAG: SDR family oxidoreductase [bacterium]|nr:SDR family oxidoreductase [bacterium]